MPNTAAAVEDIDVTKLREQVFAMFESVGTEMDQTDEGPERQALFERWNQLANYHHILMQQVFNKTSTEFAGAATRLESFNTELKSAGDAVDKFAQRIALVDKALGVLRKLLGVPHLLTGEVQLAAFRSFKMSAEEPPGPGTSGINTLEMFPPRPNSMDRVWAIWTEGPYNARVRILYRHPTALGMCRVEGVHGTSYVHEDQLRLV
ncbi:hypothetical protein [Variovorax paradoxus]|jgi:hypothetical protein|uniref:hypothetical protein n=1 Tax=Variovorax paradoxus TaxID=34073 RepID=UPI00339B5066